MKNTWKMVGTAIVALFVIVSLALSTTVIKPTERGIRVTLGKAGDEVLTPGFVIQTPFLQTIKKYSISPKQVDFRFAVGDNGAVSKDMQTIGTQCTIFWKYSEPDLLEVVKNYTDSSLVKVIENATHSSIKETIGTFTIYELVERQNEVQTKTLNSLIDKTKKYPVEIVQLTISNWDWPDSFDQQIAETMKRTQMVKQAEQELLITEQNSKRQIKEAEARKQAVEIEASAELVRAEKKSEAIRVEADAIAYKNAKLAQNITVEIRMKELEIEAARVEKWNGQYVPTNNYGPIPVQSGSIQGSSR